MLVPKVGLFLKFVLGDAQGVLCVSRRPAGTKQFEEEYFNYPGEIKATLEWLAASERGYDLYFCPNLLAGNKRDKASVLSCGCAWADLDSCKPENMLIPPTIVVETSPQRYQGYWVFDEAVEPAVAEDISRRIAYYHAEQGADKSGWDLSQLLRIPYSYNYKYGNNPAAIQIRKATNEHYTPDSFSVYPQAEGFEYTEIPFPTEWPQEDADATLQKHRTHFHPRVWDLYNTVPDEHKWSTALWQLEMLLFEGGMVREEVFIVAKAAKCNKYERDGRSDKLLWKDVCRAWARAVEKTKAIAFGQYDPPHEQMLTDGEREWVTSNLSIVERYISWARQLGDAAWQYHQAGAFITLSSLLAGSVRLPTSYGMMVPNLWFMILADTTLTRKTTAMDISVDLLTEIDPDIVLATDGSIEGLMTSLSMRPGQPSLFLRDEFSGLLSAMEHKDYMSGMAEMFTKLYDGKFQKRVLRKEIIEVRDPRLILFAGGIKTRVQDILTYEQVASGFIPRFIIVSAEADIAALKPLGPPSERSNLERAKLLFELTKIKNHYCQTTEVKVGMKVFRQPKQWDARLTEEAWALYNKYETTTLAIANRAGRKDVLTPTMDRLCKSGLKCAVILAAVRHLGDQIVVEEQDLVRAFYYVEQWRGFATDLIQNIGKSIQERGLEQIERAIVRSPGVMRSTLMQYFHLTARDTDMVLQTLEQRGTISRVKNGRSETLWPSKLQEVK